ncbi:putative hyoscyamine 6-dioxygenase [Fonsecaea pedrosoi]|nr:putative hyoscyamine 6-dioxygenase [Fonsecaea pedrosoi]
MSIPTIDLRKAGDPTTRPELLQDLRHALFEVGFLYLSGHGIRESIVQDLVDALPRLFALPDAVKDSVALVNSPHFLGYSKFGSEVTARVKDQREQFEFANELPDRYSVVSPQPLYIRLQGPNQWPDESANDTVPRFREIVELYIAAMHDLALRFLELVTEALDLPPHSLEPFTGPQDRLKLVHYRPTSSPSADATTESLSATQGVGPHKDSSGWMTFLLQASDPSIPGLQVLSKDGEWLDAPPVPGTLVVNMGQAFEVVTNGICKATTHRVLLPPGDYDRYSVPFFQGVRPDLSKSDLKALWDHFAAAETFAAGGKESAEGQQIDSPFLRGRYDSWGEAQLRTKIRSHRDVGARWYADVFDKYVNDD